MNQAVVLCGGAGTRLGASGPKPLTYVAGRPFIEYKFEYLALAGITDVLLLCGPHLQATLDTVARCRTYGLDIEYWADDSLGTGGAVYAALDALEPAFWLTYGDALPLVKVESADDALGDALAAMTVIPHHRPNVQVRGGYVAFYTEYPLIGGTHLDYGMLACRAELFDTRFPPGAEFSIQSALVEAVERRRVRALEVDAPLYHINTPDDLDAVQKFLEER